MFKNLMKEAGKVGTSLAEEKLKIDLDGDGQIGGSGRGGRTQKGAGGTEDDGMNIPLSSCDGNRRSLFVGINYFGSQSELRGCINDVKNIKQFVVEHWKFPTDAAHMKTLTDDSKGDGMPTKQNVLAALKWLVEGAKSGDSLFFHYSGHGAHQADASSDEVDGQDETIVPVDYESAGQIVDDELYEILVAGLPVGVRLTAIMDCCHSGSVFDLPYSYTPDGNLDIVEVDNRKAAMEAAVAAGMSYMRGDKKRALESGMNALTLLMQKPAQQDGAAHQNQIKIRSSMADVIQFSGCRDEQTSADASIGGESTGAMSWAFREAFAKGGFDQSYVRLLGNIRTILQGKYSQIPQMSTGHRMDMSTAFKM
jgi:metacaspase-1